MGIPDRYGVDLRHPIRGGRHAGQIGHKGISNRRWIAGGKFCAVVNRFGLICDWDCAEANVHGQTFHPLLRRYDGRMVVLADRGLHRAAGAPANVMICRRGQWDVGMKVETVFSVMIVKWGFKEQGHRGGQVLRRIWRMRWRGSTYWRNGVDWNRTRRGAFSCLSPIHPLTLTSANGYRKGAALPMTTALPLPTCCRPPLR